MGWRGPMTHRQYRAWHAWLLIDKNRPGKVESYLMQVAYEVRAVPYRIFGKEFKGELKDLKLKFGQHAPAAGVSASQAAWRAAVGM